MSGGSLNYIHIRLQDAAESISRLAADRDDRTQLQAFAGAVQRFAELMRAVEYDFSDDSDLTPQDYVDMEMYTKAANRIHIAEPTREAEGLPHEPQSERRKPPMCVMIFVDGREIESQGQAREFFGTDLIFDTPTIPGEIREEYSPECCLCHVDVEAMAKSAGFTATYDPAFPAWELVRTP